MSKADGALDSTHRLEASALGRTLARPTITYFVLLDYGRSLVIEATSATERFEKMRESDVDPSRDRWAACHLDPQSGEPAFCGNDEKVLERLFRRFEETFLP